VRRGGSVAVRGGGIGGFAGGCWAGAQRVAGRLRSRVLGGFAAGCSVASQQGARRLRSKVLGGFAARCLCKKHGRVLSRRARWVRFTEYSARGRRQIALAGPRDEALLRKAHLQGVHFAVELRWREPERVLMMQLV